MPNYRIVRHPNARSDLFKLVDLVAGYAGIKVAERKLSEIEALVNSLQHTPHLGSLHHDIYPNLRAIPVAGKGVLCFVADDAKYLVKIICIGYAGSNWSEQIEIREPLLSSTTLI